MGLKARLVGCCMAAALLATALLASSASASKPETNYIGLGDSLAFGYTQQKFEENFPTESPTAFEEGYVTLLGKKLHKLEKEAGNSLNTIDLGCPGELSDGLIGHNEALGGGSGAEFDPCLYHNVDGFPLHFEHGSSSQLEAALGIVSAAPSATKVVTINIGSNDELKVVHLCEEPAYLAEQGFGSLTECILIEASEKGHYYSGGVFHHIIANTGDTIGVLRACRIYGTSRDTRLLQPPDVHPAGKRHTAENTQRTLRRRHCRRRTRSGRRLREPVPGDQSPEQRTTRARNDLQVHRNVQRPRHRSKQQSAGRKRRNAPQRR